MEVKIFIHNEGSEMTNLKQLKEKDIRDVFINDEDYFGIKFEHVKDDIYKIRYSKSLEEQINKEYSGNK